MGLAGNSDVAFRITVASNGLLRGMYYTTQLQSSFLFCLLLQADGQASGQMLLKNLIVRKKGC